MHLCAAGNKRSQASARLIVLAEPDSRARQRCLGRDVQCGQCGARMLPRAAPLAQGVFFQEQRSEQAHIFAEAIELDRG